MFSKYTDIGKDKVKKPQVSGYPVSRPQANGKHVLLCHARGMFPDLVRFTWQAEDQSGRKVELTDDELLEQRDNDQEVQITSMLIVDQQKAMNNNYTCSVEHDSSFDNQTIIIPRGTKCSKNNKNYMFNTFSRIHHVRNNLLVLHVSPCIVYFFTFLLHLQNLYDIIKSLQLKTT